VASCGGGAGAGGGRRGEGTERRCVKGEKRAGGRGPASCVVEVSVTSMRYRAHCL
jgi:hypothetical protein